MLKTSWEILAKVGEKKWTIHAFLKSLHKFKEINTSVLFGHFKTNIEDSQNLLEKHS